MKPLNFKKLFCVLLSASILVPSVAKAEAPMSVPPVPDHNSPKSAGFMKKNWPYFAAGVPGAAIIMGAICYAATHGGKKEQPRALQADPSNILITAEQWEALVNDRTEAGELPGAQVWAECATPTNLVVYQTSPLPCYFFEITNLDTFKNYLHKRCKIAKGSDKEQKILEWANHIFYKDVDVNKTGHRVKHEDTIAGIFGGNDGGSTFANDLNAAVRYFDDRLDTQDRSMTSRLIYRFNDDTKEFLTMVFIQDSYRKTGLPALNGNGVRPYVASDAQTELVGNLYESISISTPGTANVPVIPVAPERPTTTTTANATTPPDAAAAESGRAKHLGTDKDPNHAYVNGLRFGRVGYNSNSIIKGATALLSAAQGKTDVTNTRICYWVEDLADFVIWVETLFNGQFNKEAEDFAVNVLMHQNRWLLQETCARKPDEQPAEPADQPQPENADSADESSNGGVLGAIKSVANSAANAAKTVANSAANAVRLITNATVSAATTTEWTTGTAFSYNANAWDKGCQEQLNSNGDEQRKKAMDDNVPDDLAKTPVGDLPFGGPVYKDARWLGLKNQGAGSNFCQAITRESATEQALLDQKESFDNIIAAYGYKDRTALMAEVNSRRAPLN